MSKLPDGWLVVEISQITTDASQTIPEPGVQFRYIDIGSVNRVKEMCRSS